MSYRRSLWTHVPSSIYCGKAQAVAVCEVTDKAMGRVGTIGTFGAAAAFHRVGAGDEGKVSEF